MTKDIIYTWEVKKKKSHNKKAIFIHNSICDTCGKTYTRTTKHRSRKCEDCGQLFLKAKIRQLV